MGESPYSVPFLATNCLIVRWEANLIVNSICNNYDIEKLRLSFLINKCKLLGTKPVVSDAYTSCKLLLIINLHYLKDL